MSNKNPIKGNFTVALNTLIQQLVSVQHEHVFVQDIIMEWDRLRGKDWFIETRKSKVGKALRTIEEYTDKEN
jgi:hypothetical protein